MAYLNRTKPYQLKPKTDLKISFPFATSIANPVHDQPLAPSPDPETARRIPRGKPRNSEKVGDVICRMKATRLWTTRLQNSIRSLAPVFDHSLVYNVLQGARNAEHALRFFRWVERAGFFKHDRETHSLIIRILGRASKLNHARCILFDMPKKGVEWDEDMFVYLIDAYGKAGLGQESVKVFTKMGELGVERSVEL